MVARKAQLLSGSARDMSDCKVRFKAFGEGEYDCNRPQGHESERGHWLWADIMPPDGIHQERVWASERDLGQVIVRTADQPRF
jgi:hypothetical protein